MSVNYVNMYLAHEPIACIKLIELTIFDNDVRKQNGS